MLALRYDNIPAGAPDTYGTTEDVLYGPGETELQRFRKSVPGAPSASPALAATIDQWLAQRGGPARPVYIMVHGYLYDPTSTQDYSSDSPFGSVFGNPPDPVYNLSWLPLVGECNDAGTPLADSAIAFAYTSDATAAEWTRAGWNQRYQYAVFDLAPLAARALATVIAYLGTLPVTIRILAHSLGTRTMSQAIGLLHGRVPANLERLVLLDGAEFCVDAQANLLAKGFDVINIVNRADRVLLLGGQTILHPIRPNNSLEACSIGFSGLCDHDQWLDLQLDRPELVAWFASGQAPTGKAYAVDGNALENSHPFAAFNHWCCYTNDGNRTLVRDLLQDDRMTVAALRKAGVPGGTTAPAFGHFAGVPIPPVPTSRQAREDAVNEVLSALNSGSG